MIKFNSAFQRILTIASLSMLLATIIISAVTINYIKQEKIKAEDQSPTSSVQSAEEILKPGAIGENIKSDNDINAELPQVIANVSGTIKEIKNDRIVLKGDGVNFKDGILRDLTAVFTAQTITITAVNPQVITYEGPAGLKYLKIGDNILVEGAENLRGKTEFRVKTINILQ